MKAMQYVTTQEMHLRPYEMKPCGSNAGNCLILRVNEQPEKDPVIGLGVALTGSSCYELNTMDGEKRRAFLENIYGRDGLNLSVGRISIGASDYSAEIYTYDDVPGDEGLAHFSVARDEEYVIPMIREALLVNPELYLYASPWSPPGWMKTGNSICGGYMRERYAECYADYFVRFLQAYAAHGIPVRAVTPQNECDGDQSGFMPACRWHPETEAKFISALKQRLRAQGMDTHIWMYDHNFTGWLRVKWMLEEYPELLEDADAVAFHYYDTAIEWLDELHRYFPALRYHFTEGGPRLYDHYDTDHCKWTTMMAKAFNHGCRSFTGWNLLLDETGGPNVGPFFCGGLATLNHQTGEITYSGQSRALAHFSRFVQRGAMVHAASLAGDGTNMFGFAPERPWWEVQACAFGNPDGSHVLVLVNSNASKRQVQYRYGGEWWYIELLPNSASTIVFEK